MRPARTARRRRPGPGDAAAPSLRLHRHEDRAAVRAPARISLPCTSGDSCEESLVRLGTDRIDLLQIHYDEPERPVDDVIGPSSRSSARGRSGATESATCRPPGSRPTSGRGVPFSAHDGTLGDRAADGERGPAGAAAVSGVAGIAFSVTGRGLLSGSPPSPDDSGRRGHPTDGPAVPSRTSRSRRAASPRRWARSVRARGKTIAQVAIAWVLAQPGIVCALTGPSSIEHLEENLGASGWEMDPASARELEALPRG